MIRHDILHDVTIEACAIPSCVRIRSSIVRASTGLHATARPHLQSHTVPEFHRRASAGLRRTCAHERAQAMSCSRATKRLAYVVQLDRDTQQIFDIITGLAIICSRRVLLLLARGTPKALGGDSSEPPNRAKIPGSSPTYPRRPLR